MGVLEALGVVAFAVVFGFWWAFKPRSSSAPPATDRLGIDPLLQSPPRRTTPPRPEAPPAVRRPPAPARSPRADHQGGFRPDIEGLRAVAVLLVLAYHAGVVYFAGRPDHPWFFDGGFVGVDVFFVVSGFLITSLLLR